MLYIPQNKTKIALSHCSIEALKNTPFLLSFFLFFLFFFVFLRNTFHVSFVRRFEPFSSPIISFLLIRCYNSQLTRVDGEASFLTFVRWLFVEGEKIESLSFSIRAHTRTSEHVMLDYYNMFEGFLWDYCLLMVHDTKTN